MKIQISFDKTRLSPNIFCIPIILSVIGFKLSLFVRIINIVGCHLLKNFKISPRCFFGRMILSVSCLSLCFVLLCFVDGEHKVNKVIIGKSR